MYKRISVDLIKGTARSKNLPWRSSTTIHDISHDLLDLILLHIPSAAGIIRAAATCKLWRRVIGTSDIFLRRFRRLHAPHLLGHYYTFGGCGVPWFVPLPATIGGIDKRMSFDFFPDLYHLSQSRLTDSRGGLLAFVRNDSSVIVTCPWTRQHRELRFNIIRGAYTHCLAAFFLDGGDETAGATGLTMSNFRVLYVNLMRNPGDGIKTVQAWVFSARDDQWLQLSTMAIGDMIPDANVFPPPFVFVGRAGGSLCWSIKCSNNVILHLDESTCKFSNFTLPGDAAGIDRNMWFYNRKNIRVIGGEDGAVYLVRIVGDDLELLRYARRSGEACVVETRIDVSRMASIDENMRGKWYFSDTTAAPGHIVLRDKKGLGDVEYIWSFSVDIQNLKLERVQKLNRYGGRVFPYELPWTISVCL